jgi:hypothetical protein
LDQAKQQFDRSLQLIEGSSLSQEIKDNAKLVHHFNLAGLDITKKDYAAAQRETEEFRQGAALTKNPAQLRDDDARKAAECFSLRPYRNTD